MQLAIKLRNTSTLIAKSLKHNTTLKATLNDTQDLTGNIQPMNAWQRQDVDGGRHSCEEWDPTGDEVCQTRRGLDENRSPETKQLVLRYSKMVNPHIYVKKYSPLKTTKDETLITCWAKNSLWTPGSDKALKRETNWGSSNRYYKALIWKLLVNASRETYNSALTLQY